MEFIVLKSFVDGKFVSTKAAGGFIDCIYCIYETSSGQPNENMRPTSF